MASNTEKQESLFSLRREREMTQTHAVLWTVILVATVVDILLTLTGMRVGFQEGNVVVRAMLGAFGPAGLWVVKFAAMCWLVAGWVLLSNRKASVFLALFAIVTVVVTAHNALLFLGSGAL